jgi:penicillin-binding protein 2
MSKQHRKTKLVRTLMLALTIALSGARVVFAQSDPEEVVANFLDAWNDLDYARMYGYLSAESQTEFPQPQFISRYEQTTQILSLSSLTYSVGNVQRQGLTAAVAYDVTLSSSAFGQIADPGRTMRLVNNNGTWGVAWSTMDIFDALSGTSTLRVESRQQPRARIYDRSGEPIAQEGAVTSLYGQQQAMANVQDCINLLARTLRQPAYRLQARFDSFNPDTIFYLGEIDSSEYQNVSGSLSATCGLQTAAGFVNSSALRTYNGGSAMSHVLGYIGPIQEDQLDTYLARGYSSGDLVGQAGIELAYETQLAGQPERVLRIVEPGGTTLRELAGASGTPPTPVQVTLDARLQLITSQALTDAYVFAANDWGAPSISSGAAAVILDVNTGAILALTSYPPFDPYLFNPGSTNPNRGGDLTTITSDPRRPTANRVTQEQFFPGSVYKIFTLTAALNEGIFAPTDTFDCQYDWYGQEFGDTLPSRADWRKTDALTDPEAFPPTGLITPAEALMSSCNPFFYQSGALLFRNRGAGTLVQYSQRMGLGQLHDLNRFGLLESPGTLPIPGNATSAINSAVGQGDVAIPPIQMAIAVASIANGGTVYQPYLVQQVGGFDGAPVTFTAQPEVINTLDLQPGVLETVQQGMCGVTTNERLGTAYIRFSDQTGEFGFPAAYTVCGKTGTAQTGRYPNAWFIAYTPATPAEGPQIAIVVMVDNSLEGSQVAAPIVRRILDDWYNQPRQDYPFWWGDNEPYVPLTIPEGSTGG